MKLTERQLKVAKLRAQGEPHKEISSRLNIGLRSVMNAVTEIHRKLKVNHPVQLLAVMIREGQVEEDWWKTNRVTPHCQSALNSRD